MRHERGLKTSHENVLSRLLGLVSDISPYRPRFGNWAHHRLLLVGFDVPLRESEFRSLSRVLESMGEETFIYTQLERFPKDDDAWIVPRDDYAAYYDVEVFVESLLCSRTAEWVVLCSSEGHSVVASIAEGFARELALEVGAKPLEDALYLIDHWRELYELVPEPRDLRAGPPDWIPSLLEQVLEPPILAAALREYARIPGAKT